MGRPRKQGQAARKRAKLKDISIIDQILDGEGIHRARAEIRRRAHVCKHSLGAKTNAWRKPPAMEGQSDTHAFQHGACRAEKRMRRHRATRAHKVKGIARVGDRILLQSQHKGSKNYGRGRYFRQIL